MAYFIIWQFGFKNENDTFLILLLWMGKQQTSCYLYTATSHTSPQEGQRLKRTADSYKSELHGQLQAKAVTLKAGPAIMLLFTPRRLGNCVPHGPCYHTRNKIVGPHTESGDVRSSLGSLSAPGEALCCWCSPKQGMLLLWFCRNIPVGGRGAEGEPCSPSYLHWFWWDVNVAFSSVATNLPEN